MKVILQNVEIISPGSPHHLKRKDILIDGETIADVDDPKSILSGGEIIDCGGASVSSGWFDLHVNFSEPGFEYKEDIMSGMKAAVQGGFTGVLVMPSTDPPVSSRSVIEFIKARGRDSIIDIQVAGSLSENMEGRELSGMYDMFLAGTRVFTDDKKAVQDGGLMTKALLYSQDFGGKVFAFPEDRHITGRGMVNEGVSSTALGLKGSPSVAEEIMISRDLMLASYTGSPVHFSTVSSRGSIELIRRARRSGLKVTADVSAAHLLLNDESLSSFDPVYKLKPPLRTEDDRQALIEGLTDGTIDCITSDHTPQDTENKKKEFELAAFGAAGLETAFAAARTATAGRLSVPELISKFTTHPRSCAGLKTQTIEKGHSADLTVFDAHLRWSVSEKNILSKSANNPFIGRVLSGKALLIINRGKLHRCV